MFLYEWFIPLLILALIALTIFFFAVSRPGSSGRRSDGRTVLDRNDDDAPPED